MIAKEIGAIGVIVSNHGGRVLDGAIASLRALPDVRQAVGPGFTVLMDGGIRRGADAFKALALGADALMVGRPMVQGLAVAGAMEACLRSLELVVQRHHHGKALACQITGGGRGHLGYLVEHRQSRLIQYRTARAFGDVAITSDRSKNTAP